MGLAYPSWKHKPLIYKQKTKNLEKLRWLYILPLLLDKWTLTMEVNQNFFEYVSLINTNKSNKLWIMIFRTAADFRKSEKIIKITIMRYLKAIFLAASTILGRVFYYFLFFMLNYSVQRDQDIDSWVRNHVIGQ